MNEGNGTSRQTRRDKSARRDRARVHDGAAPVDGAAPSQDTDGSEHRPPPNELRSGPRFGSIAMPVEKSKDFGASARRLIGLLRPERPRAFAVVSCAITSVVLVVIGPRVLAHATNLIVAGAFGRRSGGHIDLAAVHRTLLTAGGLYVCAAVLANLQAYMLAGVVQRTMQRLRTSVESKLNRLPLGYVDRQPRGDLLSRVTNDIDNIAQSLQQSLSQLLTSTLTIVGVLVMMLIVSWELALVALVTIPLSFLLVRSIAKRSRPRFIAQWRHTGTLNGQIEEAFTGHAIVTAFNRSADVEARFDETNAQLFGASFGAQFISGAIQPTMMFLSNLNYVAIAVVGGLRVASGAISVGDVQAFIQYSRQFSQPLTQVAAMFNVLQSGVASAERVFELLDAVEEPAEATPEQTPSAPHGDPVRGRVEFRHVSFSYDPRQPLIDDLSIVVEPGETVAIVGPTGAGKTTLVNLVMRFYELDRGTILLDGRDITSLPRATLRSNIGMVLQDTWLFSGTIRDNIAYGNPDATDEQIRAAARSTHVDRFVSALPLGYDTIVDDEGTALSAGEKQLLTIARAFLADPAILILDEATSSVDTRTEVLIQRAMAALRTNRTSFVIAHRLSTIRDANTILVMDRGRIVEQGNHDELLAADGHYAALYNAQFAQAVAEPA